MGPGPVFDREMTIAARRGRTFRSRAFVAGLMLLFFVGLGSWLTWWAPGPISSRYAANAARLGFGILVVTHGLLTLALVPDLVGRKLAEEKERRTLGLLLASRLTSAEIVLGNLASGLIQYGTYVASGLPVAIVLPFLGGVDPALVLLAYGGMASTAFFLGCLSIVTALSARTVRGAMSRTFLLATAWLVLPFMIAVSGSRFFGLSYAWIAPVNDWFLASGPMSVMVTAMGVLGRMSLAEAVAWMVGLELAAGSVLLAWSVVRLRSVVRRGEGGGPRALARGLGRFWPRPACGDDPILWKEMHTSTLEPVMWLANVLASVALALMLATVVYYVARPAFLELRVHGYGLAAYDVERRFLNDILRTLTTGFSLCFALLAAGMAAESVSSERLRDTWTALLATPLTGGEILRGKRRGVLWRLRWGVGMLVVMWTVGLAAGSVHPLGFVAALVVLAASSTFLMALGTYVALRVHEPAQASSVVVVLVLLLLLSPIVCCIPASILLMPFAAGSAPFLAWLSLVSYRDLFDLASGIKPRFLIEANLGSAGWQRVLVTYISGITFWLAGAAFLRRLAANQFDAAVGRPRRPALGRSLVALGSAGLLQLDPAPVSVPRSEGAAAI